MASKELEELVKRAEALTADEQIALITRLSRGMRAEYHVSKPGRQWREICGSVPYSLLGEDAQDWVSRTRREDDGKREEQAEKGVSNDGRE